MTKLSQCPNFIALVGCTFLISIGTLIAQHFNLNFTSKPPTWGAFIFSGTLLAPVPVLLLIGLILATKPHTTPQP